MAKLSESSRRFVDKKLSDAAANIDAMRSSLLNDQMNVDRALRVIEECRAAVKISEDIDTVATHLRATSRALEHFCAGPTKACVLSAIRLIDQAIGGETF
jgi:hypothetical protein